MANQKLIDHLNQALSIEYAAVVQYNQHSALIQGTDRKVYEGFFTEASEEARDHAKKVADWIVNIGGVPTIEVASVRQATDLTTMLEVDLETEKEALAAYRAAHAAAEDASPIQFMIEEQIMAEQEDVWEIEKFLSQRNIEISGAESGQKAG